MYTYCPQRCGNLRSLSTGLYCNHFSSSLAIDTNGVLRCKYCVDYKKRYSPKPVPRPPVMTPPLAAVLVLDLEGEDE